MTTESLRNVKDRVSEFVDRVQREHDREALEETLGILGNRKAVRELREAERAVAEGEVVRVSTPCAASVAGESEPYALVVARPAARAIAEDLSEPVATAVIDLIAGPLLVEPTRIGKPLRRELAGVWSARRGTFRVLYRIDDDQREVIVPRIDHRRDLYGNR